MEVYSDEVYESILFDGVRHESIASIGDMWRSTIVVSGVSKTYSWTGGRIGWAVFPTVEEAQVFRNMNINYFSCVPPYNLEGARLGLESPLTAASTAKMRDAFQERRDWVVAALNRIPGVRCQMPRGAFYVFPNVEGVCERLGIFEALQALPAAARERTTPSTLLQMFLLFKYAVATMDRKSFGRIGADGKHYLRMSIATRLSAAGASLRSDDGGQTWRPVNNGLKSAYELPDPNAEVGHCVHSIAMHPSRPGVLFMQKHWDVMRSGDGRESWYEISGNLPSDFGFPIAVHTHEPNTIYVVPIKSDSEHYPPEGKPCASTAAGWAGTSGKR